MFRGRLNILKVRLNKRRECYLDPVNRSCMKVERKTVLKAGTYAVQCAVFSCWCMQETCRSPWEAKQLTAVEQTRQREPMGTNNSPEFSMVLVSILSLLCPTSLLLALLCCQPLWKLGATLDITVAFQLAHTVTDLCRLFLLHQSNMLYQVGCRLTTLKILQERAIRTICNLPFKATTQPLFFSLGILHK